MIAFVDVAYELDTARAACVALERWTDSTPIESRIAHVSNFAEYVPGEFYRRELPCILAVLEQLTRETKREPSVIVVDGYVWLDEHRKKGLGARLYDHFDGTIPVVGIAKTFFATAVDAIEVLRGESSRPLYVSAVGVGPQEAANQVARMQGKHRIPTVLNFVDRLSKGNATLGEEFDK